MRLKQKAAVVTGGGTGIGKAICLKLAQEGCAVAVNYSKSRGKAEKVAEMAQKMGVRAVAIKADISKDLEVRNLMKTAFDNFGRLDILVNNAGFTRRVPHQNLDELTEELLEKIWAINVKGPLYCMRAAIPFMLKNGNGSVVNITSDSAFHGDGSSVIYCAAKAALANITKSLARALAPAIRVNAVAPGFVDTGFVKWEPGVKEKEEQLNPMGCITTVDDVAKAVLFLVAEATDITAQTIMVDGGRTVLGAKV